MCRFIYWFCHVVVSRAAVKRYSLRVAGAAQTSLSERGVGLYGNDPLEWMRVREGGLRNPGESGEVP